MSGGFHVGQECVVIYHGVTGTSIERVTVTRVTKRFVEANGRLGRGAMKYSPTGAAYPRGRSIGMERLDPYDPETHDPLFREQHRRRMAFAIKTGAWANTSFEAVKAAHDALMKQVPEGSTR